MTRPTPSQTISLEQVRAVVQNFQKNAGPQTIAEIRGLRWAIANHIMQQPPEIFAGQWSGPLQPMHAALKDSGLRDFPAEPRELQLLEQIRRMLAGGWSNPKAPGAAAAGMLFAYACDLPVPQSLCTTPQWLRENYAAFLLEAPPVFNRIGGAEAYFEYLSLAVSLFHREVLAGNGSEETRRLAQIFVGRANFTQAYFNSQNLRDLYRMRGDLIAQALSWAGHHTLHVVPPLPKGRERIRLGVFSQALAAHTETFFTIANIDHLDRKRFEIILYTLHKTDHPLERLAASRCDRHVVLPADDLFCQVREIRGADLDVLLIGTNMTAIMNSATFLGAHRLARIQIATEASPVTTGLHHVDVMLTAQWNAPSADAQEHYTELLYRMPGSNNVYAYQYDHEQASVNVSRESLDIHADQIVFFSGANFYKVLPELFAAWAQILAHVPNSVLVLMPFNPNWSNRYQTLPFLTRINAQLDAEGVSRDRLRVINPVPTRADVHRIIELADVYLDSYPFAGACSLLDTLVAGVPPVARLGRTNRSGHAASMLRQIGLEGTTATTPEQYVETAVQLACDKAWRERLRAQLKALSASPMLSCQDTRSLSTRTGAAFESLYGAYRNYYERLRDLNVEELLRRTAVLLPTNPRIEPGLAALTDVAIVQCLLAPFFQSCASDAPMCMLDVGACFGQMAEPFLAAGWEVHLFEPDPESRVILEKNVAPFVTHARIVPMAVSNFASATVSFHKSRTRGLSGLDPSPYGETAEVIQVPTVRLADYCRNQGITKVGFLKIDAEGHDFEVLESHDWAGVDTRLVMLEFGTDFAGQTVADLNRALADMKGRGYRSVLFACEDNGNFKRGVWRYQLTELFLDQPVPDGRTTIQGNALFFRHDDKSFLLALHALLDCACPRRAFLEDVITAPPVKAAPPN